MARFTSSSYTTRAKRIDISATTAKIWRFWCCMLLLLISTSTVQSFATFTTSRFSRSFGRTATRCFQSSNNGNNINGGSGRNIDNNNKIPQTGWNHNLPDESSDFWQPSTNPQSRKEPSAPETPLRTGWLHNTESPSEKKKQEAGSSTTSTTSMARQRLEQAMKEQRNRHEISAPPTFHAADDNTMIMTTEHTIQVPLYHDTSENQKRITLYFSIVEKVTLAERNQWLQYEKRNANQISANQRAQHYVQEHPRETLTTADRLLLYLQGGPGFGAPTPVVSLGLSSSWLSAALQHYDRVVLMDQRGTGRSTPITAQRLKRQYPNLFLFDENEHQDTIPTLDEIKKQNQDNGKVQLVQDAVQEVYEYMCSFRADSIVQDAEILRDALLFNRLEEQDTKPSPTPTPWGCCLGQSYGGFCQMTYLSQVKDPPRIMLFTGGIAPMLTPLYDVYSSLWERVKDRSLQYYDMFPSDISLVKRIVQKLIVKPVVLPSGGRLTARRFLQLGLSLGGSPSSFASLHKLFSSALIEYEDGTYEFNRAFLKQLEIEQSFDDAPLYFWMHETIYGDGPTTPPSIWAAQRSLMDKPSEFDYMSTAYSESDETPVLFYGEMVFPWMSDDYGELRSVGLKAVAEKLAQKNDWKPLYDAAAMRQPFIEGKTSSAAAVYQGDMFVDYDCCMKVTARGGPLEYVKCWITNEYQHSGLRDDGKTIFSKLHSMATGGTRVPS